MGFFEGFKKIVVGSNPSDVVIADQEKQIKTYMKAVEKINNMEQDLEKLTNKQLRDKTQILRARVASGTPIDSLLIESFAVVREASWRVLKLRHFDVQVKPPKFPRIS